MTNNTWEFSLSRWFNYKKNIRSKLSVKYLFISQKTRTTEWVINYLTQTLFIEITWINFNISTNNSVNTVIYVDRLPLHDVMTNRKLQKENRTRPLVSAWQRLMVFSCTCNTRARYGNTRLWKRSFSKVAGMWVYRICRMSNVQRIENKFLRMFCQGNTN